MGLEYALRISNGMLVGRCMRYVWDYGMAWSADGLHGSQDKLQQQPAATLLVNLGPADRDPAAVKAKQKLHTITCTPWSRSYQLSLVRDALFLLAHFSLLKEAGNVLWLASQPLLLLGNCLLLLHAVIQAVVFKGVGVLLESCGVYVLHLQGAQQQQ